MGRFGLGILDRLIRRGRQEKESRTVRVSVSSGSTSVASDKDYEKFSEETYLKNIIAYRCIEEIARSVASTTWNLNRVSKNGELTQVFGHPINDLLDRPNPGESWGFLLLKTVAFMCLSGNSFLERVMLQTRDNLYPQELYVLRPDRISIELNKNTGRLDHYEYKSGGGACVNFPIDPITLQSDILHYRLFHPTNDYWGAGPVEPAARTIDSSNEATDWNLNLVRNQGRPGMVFTLVGDIDDDEFDRFEKALTEKFTGNNIGSNLILTGDKGTGAAPYSLTPAEMEFVEGNRELSRGIALAWGVPPMLLGIPGDNTYSNYKEARLAFWEETITFYLRLIRNETNNWMFVKGDGLRLDYNLDDIPALESRQETKWGRAQKADFLSINEKRELTGYETWGEAGDVILVEASKIPLSLAGVELEEDEEEVDVEEVVVEDESEDEDEAEKLLRLIQRGDGEKKPLTVSQEELDAILGMRAIE